MKKKILIGSIGAVIILVLVSFTGVVGYQTTKSSTIAKASPLFKVRTNRAIGEESKELTCDYFGKGSTLPFPERNKKVIIVQRVIDRIRLMDDKTFERFISNIINHAQMNNRLNNIKPDIIREALYMFRNSNKPLPIFNDGLNNHNLFTLGPTLCGCPPIPITFGGGIGGFLLCILLLPLLPLFLLFQFWCEIFPLATAVSPL
ncbi:MAG: hypothetical protein JSW06_09245 [Thermoplasmatales archaeon]|nr:MAG: hypothetical protein JSW06_09245 [Thermoplasmatales archaeon]